MAYNNAIPTPTDQLSVSQGQLLGNFAAIQTLVGIDHYTFNTGGAFEGKHKQTTFPVLGAGPTTLANEMAIYTKNVSAVPQLFVRRALNGVEIDLTSATAATTGETTLPSGIKLKWGTSTTAGTGLDTVVFANTFATIFTIMATVSTPAGTDASGVADAYVRVYTYTAAQFQVVGFQLNVTRTRLATDYHWYAIGV